MIPFFCLLTMDLHQALRGNSQGYLGVLDFVLLSPHCESCRVAFGRSSFFTKRDEHVYMHIYSWPCFMPCKISTVRQKKKGGRRVGMDRDLLVQVEYSWSQLGLSCLFGLGELLDLQQCDSRQRESGERKKFTLSSLAFSSRLSSSSSLLFESFSLSFSFSLPFRFSRFNLCFSSYSFFTASISRSSSSFFFCAATDAASSASGWQKPRSVR